MGLSSDVRTHHPYQNFNSKLCVSNIARRCTYAHSCNLEVTANDIDRCKMLQWSQLHSLTHFVSQSDPNAFFLFSYRS